MDFRFKVLVAINLDSSTISNIRNYNLYRVKSVKLADVKTFTVDEFSIEECEMIPNLRLGLERITQILEKDGEFYIRKRLEYGDSYATVASLNSRFSIEIDGEPIKNRTVKFCRLMFMGGDGYIYDLLHFKYSSKKDTVSITTDVENIHIKYNVLSLKRGYGNELEVVSKNTNEGLMSHIYMNEYSKSQVTDIFGVTLLSSVNIPSNFIIPSDLREVVLYNGESDVKHIDNLVIHPKLKKVIVTPNMILLGNIVLTKNYNLDAVKTLVNRYFMGYIKGTLYATFKKNVNNAKSLEELVYVRAGSLPIGATLKFSILK